MNINRLGELQKYYKSACTACEGRVISMVFLESARTCQDHITILERQTKLLRKICDQLISVTTEFEGTAKISQLKVLTGEINTTVADTKLSLSSLATLMNDADEDATKRMHVNIHKYLIIRFKNAVERTQILQQEISVTTKEKLTRELIIAIPGVLAPDTAGALIEHGITAGSTITAILQSDSVQLWSVRNKVDDLGKLQGSLVILHQSFIEFAALVESQGTMFDSIEFGVINTKNYIGSAQVALKEAARKRRRRLQSRLMIAGVCLMISMTLLSWHLAWDLIQPGSLNPRKRIMAEYL